MLILLGRNKELFVFYGINYPGDFFKESPAKCRLPSGAIGNYKKGSDIDIVIFGKNISLQTVNRISTKLNEELPIPYSIDIINYKSISNTELLKHINKYGKELYLKSGKDRDS